MNYKTFLPRIIAGNKQAMRDCALNWRKAMKRGDERFATRWLAHAKNYRDLIRGYQEFAS